MNRYAPAHLVSQWLGRMTPIAKTEEEFIMGSNIMADTDLGVIELYILFSLTTALVGLVRIFAPVYKKIKEKHINNLITKSPIFSILIFVIHGVIASPLLFVVLMIPSVTNKFTDAMYDSLTS